MNDFKEFSETVRVPKGAGIDGFLVAMKAILRRPRVQSIQVDNRGVIKFTYIGREDERALPLPDLEFETMMPMHIIRSNDVAEVTEESEASHAVASLFRAASQEMLYPVAFAVGANSSFWKWHAVSTGVSLDASRGEAYGYPVLYDDQIPDSVLILCAAYTRGGSMLDTRKSFKITIPQMYSVGTTQQGGAADLADLV